jgi:hypothetical protein
MATLKDTVLARFRSTQNAEATLADEKAKLALAQAAHREIISQWGTMNTEADALRSRIEICEREIGILRSSITEKESRFANYAIGFKPMPFDDDYVTLCKISARNIAHQADRAGNIYCEAEAIIVQKKVLELNTTWLTDAKGSLAALDSKIAAFKKENAKELD